MAITVKHSKVSLIPDGDDASVVRPSDWNDDHTLIGLGTMAEQDANNVAITGGSVSGVTVSGYVPTSTTITAGTGLTGGGDLSANRTLDIANTTVTAAAYGSASKTLTATVNAQGQLTALADTNIAITNTQVSGLGTASTKDAGAALGVATLDASGKVPVSELPAAVLGALSYQGTWDASTNTPTLTSSVGTKGYYYVVSVAGNTELNGITDWLVGDWAVFNGTAWQKVDNTDAVTSVNGLTGAVSLTTTNIAEGTNLYYTDSRARASNSAGTGISYDNTTGVITNAAPDQTVVLTDGTAIDVTGTYPNFTINNTAPDQTVVLNAGTGISTSGTYPNFTITNTSPSAGGDVAGPSSATDNAIARFDTTTGKLIQNSLVIIGDTGSVTGVNALTAQSLTVNNNATLGSSNTDTLEVNSRITTDLEPNANNAKDIGTSGRNWRDGFFGRTVHTVNLELTGTTSFDGAQGTSGQVLTSAGTGNTPTWTTPTTGTVTSVDATAGTGISVSGGPITTSGTLTITNTAPDQTVVLTAGTGISTSGTYPNFTVTNTAPDQTVSITGAGGASVSGTYPNFTVTTPSGTVTSVSGTAPIASSGGATPAISISQASGSTDGYLSSTDWTTFNSKGAGTVTSVGGTGTVNGISLSGTVTSSGNLTLGGTLSGVDLTTQVTGTLPIANGGTGATTAANAFNALSPLTTLGDILYEETGALAARLGIGTTGQVLTVTSGKPAWATPSASGGISWQTVKTSNFTAVANEAYPVNTTSGAINVTLPASPSAGQLVAFVDYAGTWDTNRVTLNPNGNKVNGETSTILVGSVERGAINLVYIDSTQGWITYAGYSGSPTLSPNVIADFLIVAGGGGGGTNAAGGGGAGGYRNFTSQSLLPATNYSLTVGAGGATATVGSNSVFNSLTSDGGGAGFGFNVNGGNGGSGGGAGGGTTQKVGGTGNTPSTSPSQGSNGGNGSVDASGSSTNLFGGGGGGSSSVGGNATTSVRGASGAGTSNSITGSSVTYAAGGLGGGGFIGNDTGAGANGTSNTGNGGGGSGGSGSGGTGGSGIVIIKYPDTFTISNSGGGLTFTTSSAGGFKVTSFTAGTGNIQFN